MPAYVFARRKGHIALYSGTGIGHRHRQHTQDTQQRHRSTSTISNEYTTGSRWPAWLVSMQIVVLLWRDPLEIVEAIVASVSILVVHLCLLWKPW